jgi:ribosomal protein S18 acetylase RimI-like enzyme
MADRIAVHLTPIPINLDSVEFAAICGWPFADSFVVRLLRDDIPQRVQFGNCRIWIYRDPGARLAGFGTLDVCDDYREFTGGRPHPYIPLLAVNPTVKSLGYGTSIVRHLIEEAALLACRPGECHDVLFLDVYTTSEKAISVYGACAFEQITESPIQDLQEGGKSYIVMAKRVSISPA